MAKLATGAGLAGLVVVAGILSGCTSTTRLSVDLGGSKADGTVVMGATIGEFEEVDWRSAAGSALKVCRAWGYSGAAAFSGIRERCVDPYGGWYGCGKKEVTRTYQCLD